MEVIGSTYVLATNDLESIPDGAYLVVLESTAALQRGTSDTFRLSSPNSQLDQALHSDSLFRLYPHKKARLGKPAPFY